MNWIKSKIAILPSTVEHPKPWMLVQNTLFNEELALVHRTASEHIYKAGKTGATFQKYEDLALMPLNLYFTTSELPIEKGDLYFDYEADVIGRAFNMNLVDDKCELIVAAYDLDHEFKLPNPSIDFMNIYIKSHAVGQPITEAYIQVDEEKKIKTKNNTITIKKVEDSLKMVLDKNPHLYPQLRELFHEFSKEFVANTHTAYRKKEINEWLDQNM